MKKSVVWITAGLLGLCACKPTERNYQAAYDKAYDAAQRKAAEMHSSSDGTMLESIDGPRVEIVDGDTLYVAPFLVRVIESDEPVEGNAAVAIARYGVSTNARRHLQDLRKEFPAAFLAEDGDENFYVAIDAAPSVREAAVPLAEFRAAYPAYPYIGLGGNPMIVTIAR